MTSIADIFKNHYTPISSIRRDQGRTVAEVYVTAWLVSINRIFNMAPERKLNTDQIKALVDIILREYYFLTEADMKLIYDRILRMDNFARLDMNVIINELDGHCSTRHELAESMQIQRSETRTKEIPVFIALGSDELKKIGKL